MRFRRIHARLRPTPAIHNRIRGCNSSRIGSTTSNSRNTRGFSNSRSRNISGCSSRTRIERDSSKWSSSTSSRRSRWSKGTHSNKSGCNNHHRAALPRLQAVRNSLQATSSLLRTTALLRGRRKNIRELI
jgi:hypothetical protein